jgi:5-methylcytosine-specific restriction endonuclease McrA
MSRILQLDSDGQPRGWCHWEDAITYHSKGLVSWSLGEIDTVAHGGNNRITGVQSVIATSSIIAVKGAIGKKKRYKIPSLNNTELFRRDRCLCAYCGKVFPESKLTREHVIPTSRGGEDTWTNCVAACGPCNQKKDSKMLEEVEMKLLYVPYVPSRAESLILQNRNILFCQMDYLLKFIPESSRVHEMLKEFQ